MHGITYRWGSVFVTVTDGNRAPYFEEGLGTTREIPETAGQGTNVGDPVTALDLNTSDTLTYSLEDPDSKFAITPSNSVTGQITVAANSSLDYETKQDYSMQVVVSDRAADGLTDKIEVKVLVTDVNEPPVITGETAPAFREDASIASTVARYTATDQEGDAFTWSVEGADAGAFSIDAAGNLKFTSQPDHETQEDYNITIVATDDGDPAQAGEFPVSVEVTDVNEAPEVTGSDTETYQENQDHPVSPYAAIDPEGTSTTFTWTLSGTDRSDFTITGGVLQFANIPDFERPADSGGNNVYNVTVRASDGSLTGTKDVTVTVNDVNEAPTEPTGSATITVAENTTRNLSRYSTSDPEQATIEWSVTRADASAFRIDSSGNLAFDGAPDYETPSDSGGDNIYEIAVTATDDGTLGDRTPTSRGGLTSSFDVTVTVTPVDEPPVITGTTTINDYGENGTSEVATYTANDPEGDASITWRLGGTDRADFDITGGVLTFKDSPDYESPADSGRNNHYDVTVRATDSNNKRGELHIDVIVKNVDEPPVIEGPETVDDFPENAATSRQVARYTVSDPEGATITLSLTGTDSDDFNLASNGVLTFKTSPDHEEQSSYSVTVRAKVGSGTSNSVNTTEKTLTVNIENLEERGTVSLSTIQPQAGTSLEATLEDDDEPSGTTWQWYRTSSGGSTGTAITNATSRFYTPVDPGDVRRYLRAVASYDDGHGTGKTATAVSANRVQEAPPTPVAPEFPTGGDYERSIRENTRAGTSLGAPVSATDGNNDRLTYNIGSSDDFEIAGSTGQLRAKVELDHEDQASHTITVTATDPGEQTDSVSVTITVEDVDETPVVTGPTTVDFDEGVTGTVATYAATVPDNKGIEWVLAGTDSDDLTLSGGTLTFNDIPDYETKSQYRVTIEAHEQSPGTSVGRLDVTVRVTNVDEDGAVEVLVSEPRVGQQLTPTVQDPDGGVGSIEWKWESRESGGDWSSISGATSRSYTPTRDDNGKNLRVNGHIPRQAGPRQDGDPHIQQPSSAAAVLPIGH